MPDISAVKTEIRTAVLKENYFKSLKVLKEVLIDINYASQMYLQLELSRGGDDIPTVEIKNINVDTQGLTKACVSYIIWYLNEKYLNKGGHK